MCVCSFVAQFDAHVVLAHIGQRCRHWAVTAEERLWRCVCPGMVGAVLLILREADCRPCIRHGTVDTVSPMIRISVLTITTLSSCRCTSNVVDAAVGDGDYIGLRHGQTNPTRPMSWSLTG